MIDLIIDMCILLSGSGKGDPLYEIDCRKLMKEFLKKSELFLALDEKGKIKYQYDKNLKPGTYGEFWLKQMASQDKIRHIPWQRFAKGTKTALQEAHFDTEDYKYVETAAFTECKTISTHDSDYSARIRKILKKIKIKVKFPDECIEAFCE